MSESYEKSGGGQRGLKLSASGSAQVVRGANTDRVTMLGVLLSVALSFALGIPGLSGWARAGVGVLAFLALSAALHVLFVSERATHQVMRFAHWVLGRKF